ncbi:MAG: 4-(cytidine 5'-diphospho)-2-C-methyl-D-erythritol kinase [Christensenellales bacterium]
MFKSVRLKACSKLNLALYVGARSADGFHPLESAAVTVDIADTVSVCENDSGKMRAYYGDGVFIPEEKDSVLRAARLFFQKTSAPFKGLEIKTQKKIRQMAGMGGSSADAAAVLAALKSFYGCEDTVLDEIARSAGSDISFLMRGGAAIMSGKGDDLTACEARASRICFVVVYCGKGLSTADVFGEFDKPLYPKADLNESRKKCSHVLRLFETGDAKGMTENAFNSLFAPAAALCPELDLTARKAAALGVPLAMTGSGSAMFSAFGDIEKAEAAAELLRGAGLDAHTCRPALSGIVVCSEK